MSAAEFAQHGHVSLVGAGPGDPELITLKALRRIQLADVVVYDNLVGPEILDFIPATAERIYVGKMATNHTLPQEEISQLLLTRAQSGKRVVRLKGGDPFVFGRGGEEMDLLLAAGIAVDIVPGVTAALGAAASFGFPLTHRDYAQSCVFVTGHLKNERVEMNWEALAQPNQTLVIYMGVSGLGTIAANLQTAGLPGDTPAALVYKATLPAQRIFRSTLSGLPETARVHVVKPPALVVIGRVLGLLNEDDGAEYAHSRGF